MSSESAEAAEPAEAAGEGERRTCTNFGGNQAFEAQFYRPRNEQEVLDILARHRQGRIRALGAGHSWSEVVIGSDVVLDMSAFAEVRAFVRDGGAFAEIGAGCRLRDILDRLHATTQTLPTIGAITRQTIAGAISTGTHGSGKPGMSHFVTALRVATYDAAGNPTIVTYRDGDELKAARCALGCMGVILSVELSVVPNYLVEETVRRYASLDDLIAGTRDRPLSQFILLPYGWTYVAWERRAIEPRSLTLGERLKAWFFRINHAVFVDVLFHLGIKAELALGDSAIKALMRLTPRLFITGIAYVDDAAHVLTMNHHLFRHEEMELFIPESRLAEAIEVLRCATAVFAGDTTSVAQAVETTLNLHNLHGALIRHTGSYVHHYPFFFRRILPEDTLISMASGSDPYCSISVFTYLPPGQRQPYYDFCLWLARCMNKLFGARLHWGKHFPLSAVEIARLYPDLDTFRQICRNRDPNGVFGNDYTRRVLGV